MSSLPVLGVTVVTFNAADVILDCLATLLAAGAGVDLRVVVVDNASTDGTPGLIEDWAAGRRPWAPPADLPFAAPPLAPPPVLHHAPPGAPAAVAPLLTLVRAGVNGGFAAGVNIGLKHLFADPAIPRVWVLNPDSVVPPGTPLAFATHDPGPFALMGGRVIYRATPARIQSDGGTVDPRTGVTSNIHSGRDPATTPAPDSRGLDFIMGANMVASRPFYAAVGGMVEDYFLYYEEVDWALRRGDLPLAICPDGVIHHHAGASIGSPTLDRLAAPFSIYFMNRARLRFVRRFFPASLPWAWLYSIAKAGQFLLRRHPAGAAALLAAALGLPAPARIRARLSPEAARLAFAPAAAVPAVTLPRRDRPA